MNRDSLTDPQHLHDPPDAEAASPEQQLGLPEELLARVRMLGPGDSAVLGDLLISQPGFSSKILVVASRHMGLAAVQRAIRTASGIPAAPVEGAHDAAEGPAVSAGKPASGRTAGAAPSLLVVTTARTYNLAHAQFAAVFNAATQHSCVGADGQLDPVAVWHWQKDHGIPHDGRVGPETSAAARAAAKRATAAAPEPVAPASPGRAPADDGIPAERMPSAKLAVDDGIPAERMPSAKLAVDDGIPAERMPSAKPAVDDGIPAERMPSAKPAVDDGIPAERMPSAKLAVDDGIPAERMPSAKPAVDSHAVAPAPSGAAPVAHDTSAARTPHVTQPDTGDPVPHVDPVDPHDSQMAPPGAMGSGGATAAPAPPARPDNGGPGSLARRALAANGNADDAFTYLVSDNDAVLDRNLVDYGSIVEQRTLLDAVIAAGANVDHVRRAFHAYWHVHLTAAGTGTQNVRDWPMSTLQAMHHQLKLLPDQDARAGVWNQLSLSDDPRMASRGWYDKTGNFSLGANARNSTGSKQSTGYFEQLAAPAAAGATTLQVRGGERFKVGDRVALDRDKPSQDVTTVTAVSGATYALGTALQHGHDLDAVIDLHDGGGVHEINWLDYTVRHEIAHFLDGGSVDTQGFYAMGGWATFESTVGSFEGWIQAMGGEAAWATSDGTKISQEDRRSIESTISMSLSSRQGGSLLARYRGMEPPFPISKYEHSAVPVIMAAEQCLKMGDSFTHAPTAMYAANGKRFSTSFMYGRFQYCNETAVSDRVSDYSLSAPAEFFADTYAVFYEEAGKPGVTDAEYGRLIRNSQWRNWFREHVHNRGHGPAGTGAARAPDGALAEGPEVGARPGSANRGRASGNPGGGA